MFDWYESDMSLWWNVKSLWHSLTYPFRRTWDWMVKSIQYSIVLWKDFDWDYTYILVLLQYKLKRTRKRILDNNIILRSEEVGAQIKHAEDLIQKWFDDDFCKDAQKAHDKKWGEIINFTKEVDWNGRKVHQLDIQRANVTTEEEKAQEEQEQRAIWNRQEYERQQCLDEIFAHIRKHIQEWWD